MLHGIAVASLLVLLAVAAVFLVVLIVTLIASFFSPDPLATSEDEPPPDNLGYPVQNPAPSPEPTLAEKAEAVRTREESRRRYEQDRRPVPDPISTVWFHHDHSRPAPVIVHECHETFPPPAVAVSPYSLSSPAAAQSDAGGAVSAGVAAYADASPPSSCDTSSSYGGDCGGGGGDYGGGASGGSGD